jgi:diacylglycerol kinase family enzyme
VEFIRRLLLANPHARQLEDGSAEHQLQSSLREERLEAEIVVTQSREHAVDEARRAVAQGYDQVLAAGGDGTVNAIAAELVDTKVALGIVPLGTGNVLAAELGLQNTSHALRLIKDGHIVRLDTGLANGTCFTAVAGIGLDAQISAETSATQKSLYGPWAFVLQSLPSLRRHEAHTFDLRFVDDQGRDRVLEGRYLAVVVFNTSRLMAEHLESAHADPTDGALNLMVLEDVRHTSTLAEIAGDVLRGDPLEQIEGMSHYTLRSGRFTVAPPWQWQVDGEVSGDTPLEVEVKPSSLDLLAPSGWPPTS